MAEEQRTRSGSQAELFSVELIGGVFMFLAFALVAVLFVAVNRDPAIVAATQENDWNGVILAFLTNFGIVVPIVMLVLSVVFFRLGAGLRRREAGAAGWAQQVMFWLSIGSGLMVINGVFRSESGALDLLTALPWVLLTVLFSAGTVWLSRMTGLMEGTDSISAREARVAWNLLLPSIVIVMVVAVRPLEQTFIASLTDRRFASAREVNFVGFDNYAQLLGMRLDTLPCVVDPGTNACQLDAAGQVVFPRPRDVLDESYRTDRYRELASLVLGDRELLLSARDRDFMNAVGNTMTFTFFSVILELTLGLFVAMVVNSRFSGRGLMRAAMLVPWAIPTVVSARLWEIMFRDNQSGVINAVLTGLGILPSSVAWLALPDLQLPAIIAVDVWKTTPFMALVLLAGLQVIPQDIYEAASVDGASKVRQFFVITLPMLRPTIAVALVFRTLDALRVFDVFNVLLERQKLTMATYNYEVLIQNQEFGYASAIGVVIFVIILLFTLVYVRSLGVQAE